MDPGTLLIQTKLIPPRPPRQWLARPRLAAVLQRMGELPLTTLVAGTGYGKSTTLASFFVEQGWPLAWYSLGDEDRDPVRFLRHAVAALQGVLPGVGTASLRLLAGSWSQALGDHAIDLLCNELLERLSLDTFLVLDGYQHVDSSPAIGPLVARLLAHAPPLLHLVLASRRRLPLAGLAAWRARGMVLELEQQALAFAADEVAGLFTLYGQPIGLSEASLLAARTEGWVLALQLLRQGLSGSSTASPQALLERASPSLRALFDYLAAEVFTVRPLEEQQFLLQTAVLRMLHPPICDVLTGRSDSAELLRRLYDEQLFLLSTAPEHYRYQQLFQEFLEEEARRRGLPLRELHARAAAYHHAYCHPEEAIHHYLAAGDSATAARLLVEVSQEWVRSGRAATLKHWLNRLPASQLREQPELLYVQGEAARLVSQFDEALEWYRRAEARYASQSDLLGQSRALRGQAQVYLDTVRPALAEEPLKRALKLLGRRERAESAVVLHLLAENMTNRGRAGIAAKLHAAAQRMCPQVATTTAMATRVELRTGQIAAARRRLEQQLGRKAVAHGEPGPPDAHREPLLLLALLECWMGEPALARTRAQAGLQRGRALGSPIVEAVAEIRLGHALQLLGETEAAASSYERAVQLADTFGVQRTKAEPLMGLVLLAGARGDLAGAEAHAREALAIVSRTGDEWMAALLWQALGMAATTAGDQLTASEALDEAERRFCASSDTFGLAAVQLWRAIGLLGAGDEARATEAVRALLRAVVAHGYDFLIIRPTLFTPRDRQMLPPVLLLGLALPEVAASARLLLARAFPGLVDDESRTASEGRPYHPGVTLHIQTLGRFRAWRGVEEISAWGREKARQLLQLLITERQRWLQREQIIEWLWPETDPLAAEGQFKVALNALTTALEPARPPRTPSFYIKRRGTAYRFAPPPDAVQLDVEQFEQLLDQSDAAGAPALRVELYRRALALYSGDYLPESLYEDWASETRERLLTRYLAGACALAGLLLQQAQPAEAIRWCEAVLARDACWEEAYRLLMRAYLLQGNRPQALRTYERCVRNLASEMGIEPLSATSSLYASLRAQP